MESLVAAGGGQALSIPSEINIVNRAAVHGDRLFQGQVVGIEHAHATITAGNCQLLAVGSKFERGAEGAAALGDGCDCRLRRGGVASFLRLFEGIDRPLHDVVSNHRGDPLTIRAEGDVSQAYSAHPQFFGHGDCAEQLAGKIPQAQLAVIAAGGPLFTGGVEGERGDLVVVLTMRNHDGWNVGGGQIGLGQLVEPGLAIRTAACHAATGGTEGDIAQLVDVFLDTSDFLPRG